MPKDDPGRVYEIVPYGLRVADDCVHLEHEPREHDVLMTTLECIIQDFPLSKVAEELNRRGFRTRSGARWSAPTVFELLPRLIESGPRMFTSEEWIRHRRSLFHVIQQ
jgi:hypothetical protein